MAEPTLPDDDEDPGVPFEEAAASPNATGAGPPNAGLPDGPFPWELDPPDFRMPKKGPSGLVIAVVALLPLLVVVGTLYLAIQTRTDPLRAEARTSVTTKVERLATGGAYSLWAVNGDGSPVRWNPCEPIRWVLNPIGAPPGAKDHLTQAMSWVTNETGIPFAYAGETLEEPARLRNPWQPELYDASKWAPVLISWRTPENTSVPLTEEDRAVAIPVAVGEDDDKVLVSGQVVFHPEAEGIPGFTDRRRSLGITMVHELMHVVGLGHVDDSGEIMFPFPTAGSPGLGPGDRAGLAIVGSNGGCLETPAPEALEVSYG